MKKLLYILIFITQVVNAQIVTCSKKYHDLSQKSVAQSNNQLSIPTLNSVAVIDSLHENLSWNQITNNSGYSIGISRNGGLSYTVFATTSTGINSLNVSGLHKDSLYYWEVAAIGVNPYLTSNYSPAQSGTTWGGYVRILSAYTDASNGDTTHLVFARTMSGTVSKTGLTITGSVSGSQTIFSILRHGTNTAMYDVIISPGIQNGETVTTSYTPGTITAQDLGLLYTFSSFSVTNNVPGSGYTTYTFNWNNVGTFQNSVWSSGGNQYTTPTEPNTGGSPELTLNSGAGWAANDGFNGNTVVTSDTEFIAGQQSIHFQVNPFNPVIPAGAYNTGTGALTNNRSEIFLNPFSPWIPIGSEVWMSWSVYFPYLSSILDPSDSAGYNENVIHQWSPIGSEDGPQQYLLINPGYNGANSGQSSVGNNIYYNDEAWNGTYYSPGNNTSSEAANPLLYGHIVPGVWMTFVEHTIIDDGTGASAGKGTYQLWCSVPTSGLPANSTTTDCQYQNYGGTYLWFNFNGHPTARDHVTDGSGSTTQGAGVIKFGIYNSGFNVPTKSNGYAYQRVSAPLQGRTASKCQMEYYFGPVTIQINTTGTISLQTMGPSGQTATGNCINANGYSQVHP